MESAPATRSRGSRVPSPESRVPAPSGQTEGASATRGRDVRALRPEAAPKLASSPFSEGGRIPNPESPPIYSRFPNLRDNRSSTWWPRKL